MLIALIQATDELWKNGCVSAIKLVFTTWPYLYIANIALLIIRIEFFNRKWAGFGEVKEKRVI